jgi:zinc transporter, ZIP family
MTLSAFERWHPIVQALAAGAYLWGVTALGAAFVLCTRHVRRKTIDSMEGFAAGVMLAASYWSLLAPALELSTRGSFPDWLLPALGFVAGGLCLCLIDRAWAYRGNNLVRAGTIAHKRTSLLVLAITLHNIPEGLAVGAAFGTAAQGFPEARLAAAMILAVGIGIQNFPEGLAVALPLRRRGVGRQVVLVWPMLGSRRTHCGCRRSGRSPDCQTPSAISPEFRCRGDDFRDHQRACAGFRAWAAWGPCDAEHAGWIYIDDGARCGARLTQKRTKEKQWKCSGDRTCRRE